MKNTLFNSTAELKEKFTNLWCVRKKVRALENYSSCAPTFKHANFLGLIKNCIEVEFPDEKESAFLDYVLSKYELQYLDWAHKTPWLKNQMLEMSKKHVKPALQYTFWTGALPKEFNIPTHLLDKKKAPAFQRRAS